MAETDVILTPDQRARVFISSTLEELSGERAAARRAVMRLRLVPVWYESGARGTDTDWDHTLAYTLTQTTRALAELQSGTQP